MFKNLRQLLWQWRGVLITVPTITGLVLALRSMGGLQLWEWTAYDQFLRWRPTETLDQRIVIVAIDEPDIQTLKQWTLSDATLAQLLRNIKAQKPSAIGLDIYRDLPVEPGHQDLVEVFSSTPNLIGVQKVLGDEYGTSVDAPPRLKERNQVGAIDVLLDDDGRVRRALLSIRQDNNQTDASSQEIYSLPVRLALIYLENKGVTLQPIDPALGKVGLGKAVFVPMQPNDGGYINADTGGYQILLNYRRPQCQHNSQRCNPFPTVSLTEVLENKIPANLMRDRIVLIGVKAASLKDIFFTPYSNSYLTAEYGVDIHAQITSQLVSAALDGRFPIKVWSEPVEGVWIVFWAAVGAMSSWTFLRMRYLVASILLLGTILVGGSYLAFLPGWWIPLIPPFLALIGSEMAITAYLACIEREDRQAVMNLLGQHVTPKLAQAVWRDRHQLLKEGQITGQQLTATVLFTDIKGFTGITERTNPEVLMVWLNEYMKAMSESVLNHDGVLDKFIGDAVMAVFGVPIPSTTPEAIAQDAIAAVRCALNMGAKLEQLNRQWKIQGRPTAAMRVGIATGTVVAGSLGSQQRLNYTTIGDSVNIAARLESYDKSIDGGICRILISEETYHYIKDHFSTQFIGLVQLRGRKQSLNVYQVFPEIRG
ncbi:CHASE2 domain-containing protein [Coleofasciculus sp.]|uniref:CHASE2 domain-containing protein n=1 Tax=Coleofasciculus sp. TaxID=3100458 RepID=UPI003A4B19C9